MKFRLFRLIRFPNLLMLAGIQYLIFYQLGDPATSVMDHFDTALLVLITMIIGGGGYVINDYYDAAIDRINKPDKWIAGNAWTLRKVKWIYGVIGLIGLLLSIWLAIRLDLMRLIFIYPLAVVGLWFYSYALKCKPLLGNLWVSIFCAGVVGIILLPDIIAGNMQIIRMEFWYYLAFAFIATLFREVVKDMEDFHGDSQANCKTFPVQFGLKWSRMLAFICGVALIIALGLWDAIADGQWIDLFLVVLQGFTVAAIALVWWAKDHQYYHHSSTVIKGLMAAGTLILFFI